MVHEDSFMKALFHGVIPEDIFPYPEMDGNERETVEMILQSIRKFADAHRCGCPGSRPYFVR